jgi:hypothetical protein
LDCFLKKMGLCGFARSVDAFESDKESGFMLGQ